MESQDSKLFVVLTWFLKKLKMLITHKSSLLVQYPAYHCICWSFPFINEIREENLIRDKRYLYFICGHNHVALHRE